MPAGTYFTLVGNMRANKGGLTSAVTERARLINERFRDGRRMTILTFSEAGKDDVSSYGLVDGEDVLNISRHSAHDQKTGRADWLKELAAGASSDLPVFFICDGHEVSSPLIGELAGLPHVYFIQFAHNPTTSAKYEGFRQSVHLADSLVCATKRQADLLRRDPKHGGALNDNVVAIGFPRRNSAPALPVERDDRRIVMLARIHQQKRVPEAVAAFAELRQLALAAGLPRAHQLRLDIYGLVEDKAEQNRCLDLIDEHGLADQVTLHGHTPGATAELTKSTALWLTSKHEGWGLVIAEAQQAGCVPVSVDVKFGPREQITTGRRADGFLVETPADIAEQTLRFMQMSPRKVEAMRARAVRRINSTQRSPEVYIDNWIRVFESVTAP